MINKNYNVFDHLVLGEESAVKTSPSGLPEAWRLLKSGENHLIQDGQKMVLTLTSEDVMKIVEYSREKGEKTPIDSRHTLFLAAEKFRVDEAELLKLLPHKTAALGYGTLAAKNDGLWIENVEFIPLAAEIVKAGMFRYFSPVLRGLEGGNLRVTSVALDNVPALNNLDCIAATAEKLTKNSTIKMEVRMTKTEVALKKLLGSNTIAMSEESDDQLAAAIEGKSGEMDAMAELISSIKELLSLNSDALDDELRGKLQAVVEAAGKLPEAEQKLEAAALSAEVNKGLNSGKLTLAMVDKEPFKSFSAVAMAAYLEAVPAVVPVGVSTENNQRDGVQMGGELCKILNKLGLSEAGRKKVEESIK